MKKNPALKENFIYRKYGTYFWGMGCFSLTSAEDSLLKLGIIFDQKGVVESSPWKT